MKKLYYILLALTAVNFMFTACSDEKPFSTATADDYPRIIDPDFPDRDKGELTVIATVSRDANYTMDLVVTPADHTTVSWLIDGREVETGTSLDIQLNAGRYILKVIASTATQSTHREGILQVNPLAEDPWSAARGVERIIVPGTQARLYGDNLDKVRSIVIDGKTITDFTFVGEESYIEYAVPATLSGGEHRVILLDADSEEYGANTVIVTQVSMITGGASRTTSNQEWVMTGVLLDEIASLTFNGVNITTFTSQSATEIAINCPDVADGEYKLTGKTKSGQDVQFYNGKVFAIEQSVIVSSAVTLWTGHHYVSWNFPDGHPNKTFNLIGKEVFASIKAGATLKIHYSVDPEADYHEIKATTGWWSDLPGIVSEDDVRVDVLLTQEVLDIIQEQDGFLCVGHGYYVELVTVQ